MNDNIIKENTNIKKENNIGLNSEDCNDIKQKIINDNDINN